MTNIAKATPKDITDLMEMIRKLCAFHDDPCHLGMAQAQAQLIDGPLVCFIAHANRMRVGYAVLEPHWQPMRVGPCFDIAHLFVSEAYRGHGIGRALIAAAKDHANALGAARLTIGTSPDNPSAAAAYRAMSLHELTNQSGPRFSVPL